MARDKSREREGRSKTGAIKAGEDSEWISSRETLERAGGSSEAIIAAYNAGDLKARAKRIYGHPGLDDYDSDSDNLAGFFTFTPGETDFAIGRATSTHSTIEIHAAGIEFLRFDVDELWPMPESASRHKGEKPPEIDWERAIEFLRSTPELPRKQQRRGLDSFLGKTVSRDKFDELCRRAGPPRKAGLKPANSPAK